MGGHYPAYLASAAKVRGIVFNDAGVGKEKRWNCGCNCVGRGGNSGCNSPLTISCRIGDARDLAARGIISSANRVAEELGVEAGQSLASAVEMIIKRHWRYWPSGTGQRSPAGD